MENIFNHTFYEELRVSPDEQPILLTEALLNPKVNREKMTQIMFETFNVPCMYIAFQPVLSLYSAGRTTGLVCESGDGGTQTVSIYEGFLVKPGFDRVQIAGRYLTNYLGKLITERGYYCKTSSVFEIVRDIKEKLCFVTLDYAAALKESYNTSTFEKKHEMPDGQMITRGSERFRCTEYLFRPLEMNGKDYPGIQELCFNSINECDFEFRRDLYQNIILSGGNTMYEGLSERLLQEIENRAPKSINVNVIASPDRRFAAWRGGSVLASLS
jgi:actin, other eukaryote